MFGEKVEKSKNIFTIVWDIDGECFSLLLWLNMKNYAYGIDCSDLSFRPWTCVCQSFPVSYWDLRVLHVC